MPEQPLSGIFDDNKSKKVQQQSVPNLIVGGFQDNNLEPLKWVMVRQRMALWCGKVETLYMYEYLQT